MDKDNEILMDGIDERIEAFLRGTMSKEEELAFKQEIRQNPELRNRVLAMTSLIKGLQDNNAMREETIIKENTAKSKVRPILWWACSIAAVFAIFFGIRAFLHEDVVTSTPIGHQYAQLEEIVSPYYNQYDMTNISRGDIDSATVAHLYTLFSQIQESRNMSEIIKELEPIYNSLDNDFTYYAYDNDIAWSLALAYIKDDQIDKAISILQKIQAENPDAPISQKAQELLKKIREL